MNCLAEAIGMALPGNGTIPAVYCERIRLAKDAGVQVMELLAADLKPRDIITDGGDRQRDAADMASAAAPTRCCTSRPSPPRPAWTSTCGAINEVAAKVPHICKIARPARTTWKTCTTPAASRRS